jgi:hypothetical protein
MLDAVVPAASPVRLHITASGASLSIKRMPSCTSFLLQTLNTTAYSDPYNQQLTQFFITRILLFNFLLNMATFKYPVLLVGMTQGCFILGLFAFAVLRRFLDEITVSFIMPFLGMLVIGVLWYAGAYEMEQPTKTEPPRQKQPWEGVPPGFPLGFPLGNFTSHMEVRHGSGTGEEPQQVARHGDVVLDV